MLFLPNQQLTLQVHVRKYDLNGTELWTRAFDVSGAGGILGMAADATGVYLAGYVNGALPGQAHKGSLDVFVRKYDSVGTELWTRQFGTSRADVAFDVAVNTGTVYVTGSTEGLLAGSTIGGVIDGFLCAYDTAGAELWTRQFSTAPESTGTAVAADASGVYVSARSGQVLLSDTHDVFVHKDRREEPSSGRGRWRRP